MKRFLYFLLVAAPLLGITSACSSEDDLPDADITVSYSGATDVDDVFYVVKGTQFSIDEISVKSLDASKKATIGATAYYWNYQYVGTTITEPFGMAFDTASMPVGDYMLQINSTVCQVDKSVGIAYMTFPIKIVATADDVPADVTDSGAVTPESDIRAGALPTR